MEEVSLGQPLVVVIDGSLPEDSTTGLPFSAMQSERICRAALSEGEALAEIERCSGTQFDEHVVRAFFAARDRGLSTKGA